ncbi:MAG: hypothetical protein U5Q44_01645 [Dehalococcoidia bacterium]|nr:hypothetical protein [Dehalococcoidia bacterium]
MAGTAVRVRALTPTLFEAGRRGDYATGAGGGVEQGSRRLGVSGALAAKHGRELAEAAVLRDRFDRRPGAAAVGLLGHGEVVLAVGGNLRQVGDAQDLMAGGQALQGTADEHASASPNALVGFVEDDRAGLCGGTEDRGEGEQEARRFAAAGDGAQGPRVLSRVEDARNSTRSAPASPTARGAGSPGGAGCQSPSTTS